MAVLSDRDAAAWHALAGRVAGALEPRLDRRVLANRAQMRGQGWRAEPVGVALWRARTLSRALLRAAPTLLRTDVAAFYPSVSPSVVALSLRGCGADREHGHLAADMLEGWGSQGYPGLPIGPPGSAILANAVLRPVDAAVGGVPWLRWVDDYLFAVRSDEEATRLLERLDNTLGRLGLSRAPEKTLLVTHLGTGWPGPCSMGTPPPAMSPLKR
jgi:Reverse transcriptase (RNA-dependent DNA polymerase)